MTITRRDLLNGALITGVGQVLPGWPDALASESPPYPPGLQGLRGSTAGTFEVAHGLALLGQTFEPSEHESSPYDVVVVGAGISGLSAAYFYRQRVNPNARILILDNHDDFGGHARRNEFDIDGALRLGYGGTQSLDTPVDFEGASARLLVELGITTSLWDDGAYDVGFAERHGLSVGTFFEGPWYTRAAMTRSGLALTDDPDEVNRYAFAGAVRGDAPLVDRIDDLPLSDDGRTQLRALLASESPGFPDRGDAGVLTWLETATYNDHLRSRGVTDPGLLALLSTPQVDDMGYGGDATTLFDAYESGLLGLPRAGRVSWRLAAYLRRESGGPSYIYHFPDGNATVARLLVQRLIPAVSDASTVEAVLTARFDYEALDRGDAPVRLRLSSTVVHAENTADGVQIDYVRGSLCTRVVARHAVFACNHNALAHAIPSLPDAQKAAMRANLRVPLVYAQVALRNWRAIAAAGNGYVHCPGSFFQFFALDFPVNYGDYRFDRSPDHPIVALLGRVPSPTFGVSDPSAAFRLGRGALMGTSFAKFEVEVRAQLGAMFGPTGFVEDDIAGLTVNRWPHGYTWWANRAPGEDALVYKASSRRFGNMTFASTDATGDPYTQAAVDNAWAAVGELRT